MLAEFVRSLSILASTESSIRNREGTTIREYANSLEDVCLAMSRVSRNYLSVGVNSGDHHGETSLLDAFSSATPISITIRFHQEIREYTISAKIAVTLSDLALAEVTISSEGDAFGQFGMMSLFFQGVHGDALDTMSMSQSYVFSSDGFISGEFPDSGKHLMLEALHVVYGLNADILRYTSDNEYRTPERRRLQYGSDTDSDTELDTDSDTYTVTDDESGGIDESESDDVHSERVRCDILHCTCTYCV